MRHGVKPLSSIKFIPDIDQQKNSKKTNGTYPIFPVWKIKHDGTPVSYFFKLLLPRVNYFDVCQEKLEIKTEDLNLFEFLLVTLIKKIKEPIHKNIKDYEWYTQYQELLHHPSEIILTFQKITQKIPNDKIIFQFLFERILVLVFAIMRDLYDSIALTQKELKKIVIFYHIVCEKIPIKYFSDSTEIFKNAIIECVVSELNQWIGNPKLSPKTRLVTTCVKIDTREIVIPVALISKTIPNLICFHDYATKNNVLFQNYEIELADVLTAAFATADDDFHNENWGINENAEPHFVKFDGERCLSENSKNHFMDAYPNSLFLERFSFVSTADMRNIIFPYDLKPLNHSFFQGITTPNSPARKFAGELIKISFDMFSGFNKRKFYDLTKAILLTEKIIFPMVTYYFYHDAPTEEEKNTINKLCDFLIQFIKKIHFKLIRMPEYQLILNDNFNHWKNQLTMNILYFNFSVLQARKPGKEYRAISVEHCLKKLEDIQDEVKNISDDEKIHTLISELKDRIALSLKIIYEYFQKKLLSDERFQYFLKYFYRFFHRDLEILFYFVNEKYINLKEPSLIFIEIKELLFLFISASNFKDNFSDQKYDIIILFISKLIANFRSLAFLWLFDFFKNLMRVNEKNDIFLLCIDYAKKNKIKPFSDYIDLIELKYLVYEKNGVLSKYGDYNLFFAQEKIFFQKLNNLLSGYPVSFHLDGMKKFFDSLNKNDVLHTLLHNLFSTYLAHVNLDSKTNHLVTFTLFDSAANNKNIILDWKITPLETGHVCVIA